MLVRDQRSRRAGAGPRPRASIVPHGWTCAERAVLVAIETLLPRSNQAQRASDPQPCQLNGAKWPFLPALLKSNAASLKRAVSPARASASVEFAGWPVLAMLIVSPERPG